MRTFTEPFVIALRRLRRAPGMTATAALTLGLGIGLAVAVFTVTKAVLFRELPILDADRVVVAWGESRDGRFPNVPLTVDGVREFQRHSSAVATGYFAFRGATTVPLLYEGNVAAAQVALVSGNWFEVMGARPAVGRSLRQDDDLPGASPVVVISHRAWRQQFGGDSSVIGRAVTVVQSGQRQTIVGVMPPGLDYPRGTDVWAPLVAYSTAAGFHGVVSREVDIIARLRTSSSARHAREELTAFFSRPGASRMEQGAVGSVRPITNEILGDTRPTLIVMSAAAALLLLIACVNVANLLLIRALDRAREVGISAALGASRTRIVGEWLVEGILLSLLGGALGMAVSVLALRGFALVGAPISSRIGDLAATPQVSLLAVATCVAALFISVPPAAFAARVDASRLVQSGSRSTRSPRVRKAMEGLVAAQLALAVISVSAAGLVVHSLVRLMRANLSFQQDGLLVAPLTATASLIPSGDRLRATLLTTLEAVRAIPGVRSATVTFSPPFIGGGGGIDGSISLPTERSDDGGRSTMVNLEVAGSDYFATLGTPVIRGRPFGDADRRNAPRVVIVSAAVARHFWSSQDPLGKRLRGPDGDVTVVGVVPDGRFRDLRVARPSVYFPMAQSPFGDFLPTTLLIRSEQEAPALLPAVRRALGDVAPGLSMVSLAPVESLLEGPRSSGRLNAMVLTFFAVAALLLACLGVFTIMMTMVRRRTHEFGIRMALGASPPEVQRLVLRQAVILAAVGVGVGLLAALAVNRSLEALLFQVSPTDMPTLAAVGAVTILVSVVATWMPARASAKVEPVIALRS
jgi:predicted permease